MCAQKKQKEPSLQALFADRTGLEPATFRVTGGHSNQLNYQSIKSGWKYSVMSIQCKKQRNYLSIQQRYL